MKYYLLHIYPLYIHCLRLYLLCMYGVKKASPWGKKTASSLSRKRLMRGDKSPLTIGILLAEWLCASDVRRLRIRHRNESHPTYQSGAQPYPATSLHLPSKPKTSPKSTRKKQSEPNLRNAKAGALGGSFLSDWEVGICCRVRLRTRFAGGKRSDKTLYELTCFA